jgi:hypothetical protein
VRPAKDKQALVHAWHEFSFADVVDDRFPWRHDSDKLARAVLRWYEQKRNGRTKDRGSLIHHNNGRNNGNSSRH